MRREMKHERARKSLEAVALDVLSDDKRRAVLAHVAHCDRCGSQLAALRESVGALASALPTVPLADGRRSAMRARLERHPAADRHAPLEIPSSSAVALERAVVPPTPPPLTVPRRRMIWFTAAASIVLLLSMVTTARATRARDRLRAELETIRALATTDARALDSLRALVLDDRNLIEGLTGPHVRLIELTRRGSGTAWGRIFWDQGNDRWTMFAHDLRAPGTERTYQLWLVTGDARISAGTLTPDSTGRAILRATYPLATDALRVVAITEEPAGGVPEPTGVTVLMGSASR